MYTICKRTFLIILSCFVLGSCRANPIDELLKEADSIINQNDFTELVLEAISGDNSAMIRTTARITRLMTIAEELEQHQREMKVNQLEQYMLLMSTVENISQELFAAQRGGQPQTIIPADSPYIGSRPTFQYFSQIGMIRTSTKDTVPYSVVVDMQLGYDENDNETATELTRRLYELRDFVRTFFRSKTASELVPENEARLKQEILELLNTRVLNAGRVRAIIFLQLDIMQMQ